MNANGKAVAKRKAMMHTNFLATVFALSTTAVSMCCAGLLLLLIALWAAKTDIAQARGLDKTVALTNLSFAVPLAVFGTLHLTGIEQVISLVPSYMPWRLFWGYFVGAALLAAALSIATKIQVRWSALLFGLMMFLFVTLLYLPSAFRHPGSRLAWTFVARESSFGSGGLLLAGSAMRGPAGRRLILVGRVLIAIVAVFFGVVHFLRPEACPGVPLQKLMPEWVPARLLIGYLTGAILVAVGLCILLARKTRMAATYAGTWLVLLVLFIYGPILVMQMSNPAAGVRIEGINYFADTLLFAGVILAVARGTSATD